MNPIDEIREWWRGVAGLKLAGKDIMPEINMLLNAIDERDQLLRRCKEFISKVAKQHDEADDGYYSCPKAENWFNAMDNEPPIDERPCHCWCDRAKAVLSDLEKAGVK